MPLLLRTSYIQSGGSLGFISGMSGLSILGFFVLAYGLFRTNLVPKWSSIMLFLGHLIILVFMDLGNWMFIGTILVLIGIHPAISYLKHSEKRIALEEQ
jgi:hypothetical protein